MNFNFLKKEKGSITVYVLVALLFILAIIFGRYLLANRQLETQLSALKQVKQVYESDVREYSSTNTIIDDPGGNPDDPGEEQITIPTDTSNTVPVYNYETLEYFLTENGPYYIYQEGKNYETTTNGKRFILMCDIRINANRYDILTTSGYGYWNNNYTFYGEYSILNSNRLDFNSYCLRLNDAIIFYSGNRIRVKTL